MIKSGFYKAQQGKFSHLGTLNTKKKRKIASCPASRLAPEIPPYCDIYSD